MSTFMTRPSTFWGALILAFSCAEQSSDWVCWPRATPPHNTEAARKLAVSARRILIWDVSLLVGEVVDRAGGGAHARPDQRALTGSVARAGAYGGAGARAHGGPGGRPAARSEQAGERGSHGPVHERLCHCLPPGLVTQVRS